MRRRTVVLTNYLKTRQRAIASLTVAVLLSNVLLAISRQLNQPARDDALAGSSGLVDDPSTPQNEASLPGTPETVRVVNPDGSVSFVPVNSVDGPRNGPYTRLPGIPKATGPTVTGVTDKTIEVVYYWKGERTQTSPFIKGSAAEGANLDEEQAFNAYIDYINNHASGGATFFGVPINLHGRKLVGKVEAPKNAASGDLPYAELAEKIAREDKPFAAIASHGSISSYICPYLADFGIFNMQTYDLGGKGGSLAQRTNGYCTPAGITWERQVDLTIGYLRKQMHTPTKLGLPRVYGVIYTIYPGLKDVGEAMVQRLKDAGIPIAAHARLPDSLANGQAEAQNILLEMRQAGVNTLIMPDAGSPLTITHAAQAQEYYPDYYVWPCSGEDVTGMVRLFNGPQWEGAEGLTCYDRQFNPDAVNNNMSRKSEWWKAFQEVRPGVEPPAPSPLVYSGLFQLVAGLTYAGRNLTPATFKAALNDIPVYRYDTIDGRTNDPTNMLITMSERDRSMIGDVGYLRWSATASEGGAQGAYLYPENHRYRTRADF